MMVWAVKDGATLRPHGDDAEEAFRKIGHGEMIRLDVKKTRNVKFHRKFFALVKLLLDNSDRHSNQTDLLVELKVAAGHYVEHITARGELVYVPQSINFSSMDELEFQAFYSRVVDVALERFMPTHDAAQLDRMVNEMLGFL